MPQALLLDGCAPEDASAAAGDPVRVALEKRGWQVVAFRLAEIEIAACAGCFGCWFRTPGECLVDDAARDVAREYVKSDLAVLVSPIRFGGYGYHAKKALDRLIPVISPLFAVVHGETHHRRRYDRYPAVLGVGLLAQSDPEAAAAFRRLVERNAINMCAPNQCAVTLESAWSAERCAAALDEALACLEGVR